MEEIADELRYMMNRYPAMRTLLRFDENGRPTQEVFASGTVMIEVYDADDEDDDAAEETYALVGWHYRTTGRDFTAEWPQRMAVVRHRGELTHVHAETCHLTMDNGGAQVVLREVAVKQSAPVTGMNPLELVRWQRSEAGRRHQAATERHWEKALRSLPRTPVFGSADRREPRHWSARFDSRALYQAVPVIVERTSVDSATVFMALYAIALGRTGVLNPAVIRPLVNNRFRPGMVDIVCNLVQSGICVLDVAETTVDEVILRAKRISLTTLKYAYFDAERIAALLARTAQEHGAELGLSNFFNTRFLTSRPGAPLDARRLRELADTSTFDWFEKKDNPYEPLFLHVEEGPDSIALLVLTDTHYVSPVDNEALARTIEAVAIEAALDPNAVTGVSAAIHA
jgi:hypothetical protein